MGKRLRALEFFSGIGGLHFALEISNADVEVVAAFDINDLANSVYHHIFHPLKPIARNIEHVSIKEIDNYAADVWLLSPPCQPYTLGGRRLDDKDSRAVGLLYLIGILPKLINTPRYIFLENVPNFELSNCRNSLVDTLLSISFHIEEYLISPSDPVIGIPNTRKRYFLSARRTQTNPSFGSFNSIILGLEELGYSPGQLCDNRILSDYIVGTEKELKTRSCGEYDCFAYIPLNYLEAAKDFRFDIVSYASETCSTFTKAYGSKYVIGVGSFIQTTNFDLEYSPDEIEKLKELRLRFFTPFEIASLHAFPLPDPSSDCKLVLRFPSSVSLINQYRLLGNSLNVKVVSILLQRLLE